MAIVPRHPAGSCALAPYAACALVSDALTHAVGMEYRLRHIQEQVTLKAERRTC